MKYQRGIKVKLNINFDKELNDFSFMKIAKHRE